MVMCNSNSEERDLSRTEQWYGVKYSVKKLDEEQQNVKK